MVRTKMIIKKPLVKIGNSRGIIIDKALLKAFDIYDSDKEATIFVKNIKKNRFLR